MNQTSSNSTYSTLTWFLLFSSGHHVALVISCKLKVFFTSIVFLFTIVVYVVYAAGISLVLGRHCEWICVVTGTDLAASLRIIHGSISHVSFSNTMLLCNWAVFILHWWHLIGRDRGYSIAWPKTAVTVTEVSLWHSCCISCGVKISLPVDKFDSLELLCFD